MDAEEMDLIELKPGIWTITSKSEHPMEQEVLPTTPPSPGWTSPSPPLTPPLSSPSTVRTCSSAESNPSGTKSSPWRTTLIERSDAIAATHAGDMEDKYKATRVRVVDLMALDQQDGEDVMEDTAASSGPPTPPQEDALHWRIV